MKYNLETTYSGTTQDVLWMIHEARQRGATKIRVQYQDKDRNWDVEVDFD